jgi:hypothetical protein
MITPPKPADSHPTVSRRAKLKEALDAAEMEMPNRQIDVWLRDHASAA